MVETTPAVLRPKQAAQYLGIGLSTFWLYVNKGMIKTTKLSERVTVVKRPKAKRRQPIFIT